VLEVVFLIEDPRQTAIVTCENASVAAHLHEEREDVELLEVHLKLLASARSAGLPPGLRSEEPVH
jgi:hypothetical protein